jgi:hypothetical protein
VIARLWTRRHGRCLRLGRRFPPRATVEGTRRNARAIPPPKRLVMVRMGGVSDIEQAAHRRVRDVTHSLGIGRSGVRVNTHPAARDRKRPQDRSGGLSLSQRTEAYSAFIASIEIWMVTSSLTKGAKAPTL